MARHSAENQRAYRERKKKADPVYLARENERVKKYYKPTSLVSPTEVKKRRERARISMAAFRLKHKRKPDLQLEVNEAVLPETSECPSDDGQRRSKRLRGLETPSASTYETTTDQESITLQVKFPWTNQHKNRPNVRKRINTAVSRYRRELDKVHDQNSQLTRKVWSLEKRLQRNGNNSSTQSPAAEKLSSTNTSTQDESNVITPIKKSDELLRADGFSPRKAVGVRRALILHHSIVKHLEDSGKNVCKKAINSVHVKRSHTGRLLARSLQMTRKFHEKQAVQRRAVQSTLRKMKIIAFLKREDNSTCLPGKKDTITVKKIRFQKHILNDTLKNLYSKCMQENPSAKVSLTQFCNARPKYIIPVSYANRKICLCQKHQNFALLLRALKPEGFIQEPDKFVLAHSRNEVSKQLAAIERKVIPYRVWKQEERPYKQTTIKKTVLTQVEEERNEFINGFLNSMDKFKDHARKVKTQYENIRLLKEKMPSSEITVQIDFAENYVCNYGEEVSGAYYSKQQITVHPAVIHYKVMSTSSQETSLDHKSLVILSDAITHTAPTVFAFLKHIISWIKSNLKDIKRIHYISDSPTSQYRNCSIFAILSRHKDMFGIDATWQYFESGHGKGPCDGVGGAVKRAADVAIKTGKIIQNAKQFYEWGTADEGTGSSKLGFILVDTSDVETAATEIKSMRAKPIPGTMTLHSVIAIEGLLYVRETSCFGSCCWENSEFKGRCEGWSKRIIRCDETEDKNVAATLYVPVAPNVDEAPNVVEAPDREHGTAPTYETMENLVPRDSECVIYETDQYVVVKYGHKNYVGQIIAHDHEDNEYQIKFMEQKLSAFRWPTEVDELWVPSCDIFRTLSTPAPTGRCARLFKLPDNEMMLFR